MGDHRGDLKGWGTDRVGAPLRAQHVDSGPGFRPPPSSLRPADEPPALPLTPGHLFDWRVARHPHHPHKEQEDAGRRGAVLCT